MKKYSLTTLIDKSYDVDMVLEDIEDYIKASNGTIEYEQSFDSAYKLHYPINGIDMCYRYDVAIAFESEEDAEKLTRKLTNDTSILQYLLCGM